MYFSKLLLALPFAASVLAAPVERGLLSSLGSLTSLTSSSTILNVVAQLNVTITEQVAQIVPGIAEQPLILILGNVQAAIDLAITDLPSSCLLCSVAPVASVLTSVVTTVVVAVKAVPSGLAEVPVIAGPIGQIDHSLGTFLPTVETLLPGVLVIVSGHVGGILGILTGLLSAVGLGNALPITLGLLHV